MKSRLREFLRKLRPEQAASTDPDRIPLAMAALLVEAARADYQVTDAEIEEVATRLAAGLGLSADRARSLVQRARERVERSISLDEFTRPLHEDLGYEQKQEFVRMLWHVAFADRHLDKYEEYLIGKVADLLHVVRGDVIRLRHAAMQEKDGADAGD